MVKKCKVVPKTRSPSEASDISILSDISRSSKSSIDSDIKYKKSTTATTTATTNDDLLEFISTTNLPKPKLLKSCIRCRKHKTKCDASIKAPHPCSHCAKKGIECKMDFVLPPQRSDNLKNLISQVSNIKNDFNNLEQTYLNYAKMLDINLASFEEFKHERLSESYSHSNIVVSDKANDSIKDKESISINDDNNFEILKLSNESFISMKLVTESNELIINNKIISIPELEINLKRLIKFLNSFTKIYSNNEFSSTNTEVVVNESDESQVQSPLTDPCSKQDDKDIIDGDIEMEGEVETAEAEEDQEDTTSWLDINFNVKHMFQKDKFLLLQLISYFYNDDEELNFIYNQFLNDYLNSYYKIILNVNNYSNNSTYSNIILNKLNLQKNKKLFNFNKVQLRELINIEIFNSEIFLKKILKLLFLNLVLFGTNDEIDYLKLINEFMEFIEKNINNNRKKINFEKTFELKFMNNFIKLFNLLNNEEDSSDIVSESDKTRFNEDKIDSSELIETAAGSGNYVISNFIQLFKFQNDYINLNNSLFFKKQSNFNFAKFRTTFKRFIDIWLNLIYSKTKTQNYLFPKVFIIETFIINCLIFINEDFKEFNSILIKFLSNFNEHNLSIEIIQLIEFYKNNLSLNSILVLKKFSVKKLFRIVDFLYKNKKNVIDIRINDIQLILENIDWKIESTDDVLKKIGVI